MVQKPKCNTHIAHQPLPSFHTFIVHHDLPVLIYKAKIARAAAPSRPAAWVACAAAPVNWLALAEAVAEPAAELAADPAELAADPAALVADAALLEAADAALLNPLAMALLKLDAAEATAELASLTAALALAAADEAADEPADAAAEVADATAEPAADETLGRSMGTPASAHVFPTASTVVAWSAVEQAPWTQGWTEESSLLPCLQWQAKSVREAQPSLPRGPMKQLSCGYVSVEDIS